MATDLELAANLITRVNVGDALTRTAGRVPDALAVVDGARRWTYAQLNARVNRVANGLTAIGYTRGDVGRLDPDGTSRRTRSRSR